MRLSPKRHNVARLRLFLKLGQKELADIAGCSHDTIRSVELGRLNLSEGLALKISNETGIASDWLLENDLKAPLIATDYGAFTIALYNKTRTDREMGIPSPNEAMSFMLSDTRAIVFYAWMRAIFHQTRGADVAIWKTGKFLEKLASEHGSNSDILAASELKFARLRRWKILLPQIKIGIRLAKQYAKECEKGEAYLARLMPGAKRGKKRSARGKRLTKTAT